MVAVAMTEIDGLKLKYFIIVVGKIIEATREKRMKLKHKIGFGSGVFLLFLQFQSYAFEMGTVDLHGFVSQGYLYSDNNDYLADTKGGTFDFNEAGLNLGAQVSDSVRVGAQILSRNLGEDGNNKFVFGYAYGDYQHNQHLGVRAGKIRLPVGLYNQSRDIDMLRTGVFLPNAVYHDENYTFFSAFYGGLFYGQIPMGGAGDFEYQIYGGIPDVDDDSYYVKNQAAVFGAQSKGYKYAAEAYSLPDLYNYTGDDYGRDIDIDAEGVQTYGAALLWNTPLDGLRVGYSWLYSESEFEYSNAAFYGPATPFPSAGAGAVVGTRGTIETHNKITPFQVLSLEYVWDDLIISAEYMKFGIEFEFDYEDESLFSDYKFAPNPCGFYLGASYRFSDLVQLGVNYSEFYFDDKDKDGERNFEAYGKPDFLGWLKDITFSARFDITDNWVVKAEYHRMDGAAWLPEAGVYSDANSTPNPGFYGGNLWPDNLKQKWNLIALKTTYSF